MSQNAHTVLKFDPGCQKSTIPLYYDDMRYPSFKDMENIGDEELESVQGVMKLVTNCIDSVYDKDSIYKAVDQSEKELVDFVDNLNSEQFQKMSDWFEQMPSIKHTIEFDCITCKESNT